MRTEGDIVVCMLLLTNHNSVAVLFKSYARNLLSGVNISNTRVRPVWLLRLSTCRKVGYKYKYYLMFISTKAKEIFPNLRVNIYVYLLYSIEEMHVLVVVVLRAHYIRKSHGFC